MNKKISVILTCALCVLISACSSKNNNLEGKIIGTWEPTLMSYLNSSHTGDPLIFREDKTMAMLTPEVDTAIGEIGGTSEGTYEIEGNELTTVLELPILDSTVTLEQTYTIEIKSGVLSMECVDCGDVIEYTKAK